MSTSVFTGFFSETVPRIKKLKKIHSPNIKNFLLWNEGTFKPIFLNLSQIINSNIFFRSSLRVLICLWRLHNGRVAERTSSRPRRMNDRSVLRVHEDHEDDENAEIGVPLHAHNAFNELP